MEDNKFLISDASFKSQTNSATLAVVDNYDNSSYSKFIPLIDNSHIAETLALLFAIKIAKEKNYTNVVFIYDNKNIDIASIQFYANNIFEYCQFLWLKRKYVSLADKLAKKTHDMFVPKRFSTKQQKKDVVQYFIKFPKDKIIKASMLICDDKQQKVLNTYLNNKYNLKTLHPVKFNSTMEFKYIYSLLNSKAKTHFYEYISKVSSKVANDKKFREQISLGNLHHFIGCILNAYKVDNKVLLAA